MTNRFSWPMGTFL